MLQLRSKFFALAPGSRIVSNTFRFEGWNPDKTETIGGDCTRGARRILWIVPAKVGGAWRAAGGELTLTQDFQMVYGHADGRRLAGSGHRAAERARRSRSRPAPPPGAGVSATGRSSSPTPADGARARRACAREHSSLRGSRQQRTGVTPVCQRLWRGPRLARRAGDRHDRLDVDRPGPGARGHRAGDAGRFLRHLLRRRAVLVGLLRRSPGCWTPAWAQWLALSDHRARGAALFRRPLLARLQRRATPAGGFARRRRGLPAATHSTPASAARPNCAARSGTRTT